MRMRRKKHQDARMRACKELLIGDPFAHRGAFLELFSGEGPLCVEIGCGKGGFIAGMARAHPHKRFIGIEKLGSVLLLALERAQREGLENVRFMQADAARIGDLFCESEVSELYINFPDPWPADRHAKRRLTHARIAGRYADILQPGGLVALKTDSEPLFLFSLESMQGCGFSLLEHTFDLHAQGAQGVMTEYESKFHEQGKKIMRAVFKSQKPGRSEG